METSREVPGMSQDSNGKTWLLLTCGGSHVSRGRLQVVQRLQCDDKVGHVRHGQ